MRRSDDDPVSWTIGDPSHAAETPLELQPSEGVAPGLERAVRPERVRCPRCGSVDVLPIVYGLPSREMRRAERRGELALGGCVVGRETRCCRGCSHEWDDRPPRVADPDTAAFWSSLVERQRLERYVDGSGEYRHASGVAFPPRCAGFRRGLVLLLDAEGAVVSVPYSLRRWPGRPRELSTTVVVCPREDANPSAPADLLEHLAGLGPDPTVLWTDPRLMREAERRVPGLLPRDVPGAVASQDLVPLVFSGAARPAVRVEYRTAAGRTSVWMVLWVSWWVHLRAAYSDRDAPFVREPLEQLLCRLGESCP